MKNWFLVLFITLVFIWSTKSTIIFLNGTSSAGKSSIMKELVDRLDGDYIPVSIDKFKLHLLREEALAYGFIAEYSALKSASDLRNYIASLAEPDKKKWQGHFRKLSDSLAHRLYAYVAELASAGKNVIIDHVLTHNHDIEDCLLTLGKFDVFFVLVYCPLDQLVYRVAKRNSCGKKREKRMIDSVFSYYGLIYRPGEKENSLACLSRKQLHDYFDQARSYFASDKAFYRCERFLFEKLGLAYYPSIYITPRLRYDFIVNSARATPRICARTIVKKLLKRPNHFPAFSNNLKKMLKSHRAAF